MVQRYHILYIYYTPNNSFRGPGGVGGLDSRHWVKIIAQELASRGLPSPPVASRGLPWPPGASHHHHHHHHLPPPTTTTYPPTPPMISMIYQSRAPPAGPAGAPLPPLVPLLWYVLHSCSLPYARMDLIYVLFTVLLLY